MKRAKEEIRRGEAMRREKLTTIPKGERRIKIEKEDSKSVGVLSLAEEKELRQERKKVMERIQSYVRSGSSQREKSS